MALRVTESDISHTLDQIKNKWQSFAPGQPFSYSFMDDDFDKVYSTEQRTGEIFVGFAFLAIFIACLGLFGLVAYAAQQRLKEIGIRRYWELRSFKLWECFLPYEFFKTGLPRFGNLHSCCMVGHEPVVAGFCIPGTRQLGDLCSGWQFRAGSRNDNHLISGNQGRPG